MPTQLRLTLALALLAPTATHAQGFCDLFADGFEAGVDSRWSNGAGGPVCDADPQPVPAVPAGLAFRTYWGSPETLAHATRNIWAVWWDPIYDHAALAQQVLDRLDDIRCRTRFELGMKDPANPGQGYFFNLYIHHPGQDVFPDEWGAGQGTDPLGQKFVSMPFPIDESTLNHEGFHVFQAETDSPGFAYAGDSQWFTETSAQWYAAMRLPTAVETFVQAGTIDGNPHLSLWHSFGNAAPGDPSDWMYLVHQYGLHTWLFYLTEVAGFPPSLVPGGFYGGVDVSPQEFLFRCSGGDDLRSTFADWAAHNTADFDYLTPQQVARAREEQELYGDPDNTHPHVAEYVDAGTGGEWVRPPQALTARVWAYNVVKVANSQAASYTFSLLGDGFGSEDAPAHFEARVVVRTATGWEFHELEMLDELSGSVTVEAGATDSALYLVVASVPEHFGGNQTFGFQYRIDRD